MLAVTLDSSRPGVDLRWRYVQHPLSLTDTRTHIGAHDCLSRKSQCQVAGHSLPCLALPYSLTFDTLPRQGKPSFRLPHRW